MSIRFLSSRLFIRQALMLVGAFSLLSGGYSRLPRMTLYRLRESRPMHLHLEVYKTSSDQTWEEEMLKRADVKMIRLR